MSSFTFTRVSSFSTLCRIFCCVFPYFLTHLFWCWLDLTYLLWMHMQAHGHPHLLNIHSLLNDPSNVSVQAEWITNIASFFSFIKFVRKIMLKNVSKFMKYKGIISYKRKTRGRNSVKSSIPEKSRNHEDNTIGCYPFVTNLSRVTFLSHFKLLY